MSRADNLSNIGEICPLAIPNQISFISMPVPSLVKIPWHLLKLSSGNENMGVSWADNSIKIWQNLSISNTKADFHIPSLVKIHWCFLKLSSGNENMGVSQADNKIWWNLPISTPKPDLHNINAQTKFGENPLMFTRVIIRKRNTDQRTTDRRRSGRTHRRPRWNHNILWRGIETKQKKNCILFIFFFSIKYEP